MAINSGKWTGLGEWDKQMEETPEEQYARKIMEEYYKNQAHAQKNASGSFTGLQPLNPYYPPNGSVPYPITTTGTSVASVIKDDGFYKKVAEDVQRALGEVRKELTSAYQNLAKARARAETAERELESYKGLIPWLLENHPELLEDFNVVVKAKARLDMES